jgi:hypothetical protein
MVASGCGSLFQPGTAETSAKLAPGAIFLTKLANS